MDAVATTDQADKRMKQPAVLRALLRKEWAEQRWRFVLGAVVLSAMLAGLLRAQVIPYNESALFIFWVVGIPLTIFLAAGPVAGERSAGTWTFLLAQPVTRSNLLVAKWLVALGQLLGIIALAALAGGAAILSRGGSGSLTALADPGEEVFKHWQSVFDWATAHPVGWLFVVAAAAAVSLSCWLTGLCFVLARGRNEFAAGLGGILLTILLHAWLLVGIGMIAGGGETALTWLPRPLGVVVASLNPLAPLFMALSPELHRWFVPAVLVNLVVWIVLPVLAVRQFAGRPVKR